MHYSKYAGNNRPGLITIQALDPSVEIGQRKAPSKLDIQQARLMYKCGKRSLKQIPIEEFNSSFFRKLLPSLQGKDRTGQILSMRG